MPITEEGNRGEKVEEFHFSENNLGLCVVNL